MVECRKDNIEIPTASQAVITVTMKPPGMWTIKKKTKKGLFG